MDNGASKTSLKLISSAVKFFVTEPAVEAQRAPAPPQPDVRSSDAAGVSALPGPETPGDTGGVLHHCIIADRLDTHSRFLS